MTKYQKQTIQYSLEEEKKILDTLKRDYKEAGKTIESRIKNLMKREDADLIHVIHQVNYQKALKSQIDDVLDKLNDGTYSSILKYMEDSYGTGFTSSLYRLQKQGVPLIFPMNREEILRAVQTNSKISKKKYGKNFTKMKNTIRREVTRGISTSMSFGDMARNIDNTMKSGLYNSYRVARTEGHRINQEASFDAMTKAKEAGADVVKKWDSTLDGRTRETHRSLEGQIRELDDPFEVNGKQAMYPSGFGIASEDINCRCVVLEIGRWELDEDDTYSKFNGESGVIVNDLSNIDSYEEFRKKYNIEVKKDDTKPVEIVPENKSSSSIAELESRRDIVEQELTIWRSDLKYRERRFDIDKIFFPDRVDSMRTEINNLREKIKNFEKELSQLDIDIKAHPDYVFKSKARKALEKLNIDYNEVNKLDRALSESEIISRLGGGDMTGGSCSSVAFAYMGNKGGYDVLDFRGGKSQEFFSKNENIRSIAELPNVKSTIIKDTHEEIKDTLNVLKTLEKGKEYYLSTGRHASIIRRTDDGFEYLELQSKYSNGYKKFTSDTLKNRFGCTKKSKFSNEIVVIEPESIYSSDEYKKILGYINTNVDKQKKGLSGNIK